MILTTKYVNFWTRLRKEFLVVFLVGCAIILYNYLMDRSNFGPSGLTIVGFGIIYMIISVINAWSFVNEVNITEQKIVVRGATIDSHWDKEFDIKNSQIKIKSKGRGRGNVEYYLRLSSHGKFVDINRSFNWDYSSLLTIVYEFKRIKGEKIIFDEKYFLEIMEKKAKEFSKKNIASGKS